MKFTDQLNRTIELRSFPPRKIISVVPSQTELLFDLGLDEEVMGITKFCVHPENWFRNKTRIGGTKQLNLSLIRQLQPDLIIGNKEENEQHQIDELAKEFPLWISDIKNLDEAYNMIEQVGALVDRTEESQDLISRIRSNFNLLTFNIKEPHSSLATEALVKEANLKHRTAYLIWSDPYMTVGGNTFINDMLNHVGFTNIFENQTRYPETSIRQLSSVNCQLLLLSSEPYPFKEKHVEEIQKLLPETKILLADGEMFSWYGSRLQYAPAYFSRLRELVFNC